MASGVEKYRLISDRKFHEMIGNGDNLPVTNESFGSLEVPGRDAVNFKSTVGSGVEENEEDGGSKGVDDTIPSVADESASNGNNGSTVEGGTASDISLAAEAISPVGGAGVDASKAEAKRVDVDIDTDTASKANNDIISDSTHDSKEQVNQLTNTRLTIVDKRKKIAAEWISL